MHFIKKEQAVTYDLVETKTYKLNLTMPNGVVVEHAVSCESEAFNIIGDLRKQGFTVYNPATS